MMTYRELGGQMMKQIRIKTYDEKKNGEKWYLKDSNNDLAFGFLRTSAFSETDEDCFQRCFLRNSYENEIQIFVQQLVEGIHMELDKEGISAKIKLSQLREK